MPSKQCEEKLDSVIMRALNGRRSMALELNHLLALYDKQSSYKGGSIIYVRNFKDPNICPKGKIEFGIYSSYKGKDNGKFKKSRAQEFIPKDDIKEIVIKTLFNPKIFGYDFEYTEDEIFLDVRTDDDLNIMDISSSHFDDLYNKVFGVGNVKPLKSITLTSGKHYSEQDVMTIKSAFEDYKIRAFLRIVDKKFLKYIDTKGARSSSLRFYNTFKTFIPVFITSTCAPNPLFENPRMKNIVYNSKLYEDAKRHEVVIGSVHIYYCTELVISQDLGFKHPARITPKLLYSLMLSCFSSSSVLPNKNLEFYRSSVTGELKDEQEYSILSDYERLSYIKTNALREYCNNYFRVLGYSSVEEMYDNVKDIDFISREVV